MKLAYEGGVNDIDDSEQTQRVSYEWKLYKATEGGKNSRNKENEWEEVFMFMHVYALFHETFFPKLCIYFLI